MLLLKLALRAAARESKIETGPQGTVTEAFDSPGTAEWRAAFRSETAGGNGVTECKWGVKKEELTITRHDEFKTPGRTNHLYSELKLQRRGTAGAGK